MRVVGDNPLWLVAASQESAWKRRVASKRQRWRLKFTDQAAFKFEVRINNNNPRESAPLRKAVIKTLSVGVYAGRLNLGMGPVQRRPTPAITIIDPWLSELLSFRGFHWKTAFSLSLPIPFSFLLLEYIRGEGGRDKIDYFLDLPIIAHRNADYTWDVYILHMNAHEGLRLQTNSCSSRWNVCTFRDVIALLCAELHLFHSGATDCVSQWGEWAAQRTVLYFLSAYKRHFAKCVAIFVDVANKCTARCTVEQEPYRVTSPSLKSSLASTGNG